MKSVRSVSRISILILIASIVLIGCAGTPKTPDQMTPQERSVLILTLYNNSYNNYLMQYQATPQPMSEKMIKYFKDYKEVLTQAWPVISVYVSVVQAGGVPTADQEQRIVALIYSLQNILVKKEG